MHILNNIEQILLEARSHSDLNPKISINDVLKKYDDMKHFVHFSDSLKIGINPQSSWGYMSAYGVYAYAINFVLNRSNSGYEFGFNFEYATILELVDVPRYKFLYVDEGYNNTADVKKLRTYYNKISSEVRKNYGKSQISADYITNALDKKFEKSSNLIDPNMYGRNGYKTDTFYYIHDLVQMLGDYEKRWKISKAKHTGAIMTKIFLDVLNYSGVCDINNKGSMHNDIKYETCFFHPKSYKVIETYRNDRSKFFTVDNDKW